MKKALFICSLFLSIAPCVVAEVSDAHRALIEKLFVLVKAEESYNETLLSTFNVITQGQAGENEKMKKAMERVQALVREKLGWTQLKEEMILVYSKHFSEEELQKILPKLDQEEVQLYFSKLIKAIPQSAALGHQKGRSLGPEIQKIIMEEMAK